MNNPRFDLRRLTLPPLNHLTGAEPRDDEITPHVSRPFLAVMGLVAALSAIYYGVIAAPLYVSEARFMINAQQPVMPTNLISGLLGGQSGISDLVAVQDYIQSPEMAESLDKQFHLRETYSHVRPDLLNWLPRNSSRENFLKFYQKMVDVKIDRDSSIAQVDVKSFDKATAAPMARELLKRTEAFVDGMTQRVRTATMQAAQNELTRAAEQAQEARNAVANFRGSASAVDPAAAGAQLQAAQAALTAAAAGAQSDVAAALSYSKPDSPLVRQLQARLDSIRSQAAQFKSKQSGGAASGNVPRQVTNFETLVVMRSAAEQRLLAAQTAYEGARIQAQQQEKYVVRVVEPSVPDSAAEPRRFRDFLMVLLFAMTGYAIISLLVAGIRDHQGI